MSQSFLIIVDMGGRVHTLPKDGLTFNINIDNVDYGKIGELVVTCVLYRNSFTVFNGILDKKTSDMVLNTIITRLMDPDFKVLKPDDVRKWILD